MSPVSAVGDGVLVSVRLTPRAARDAVTGIVEGPGGRAVQVRVRAVPEKGRANKALLGLLAKWVGVPKSAVTLAAGGKSRNKTVHVAGESDRLIDAINSRIAELS